MDGVSDWKTIRNRCFSAKHYLSRPISCLGDKLFSHLSDNVSSSSEILKLIGLFRFCEFENVAPSEQEAIIAEEICLLLVGYEGCNIRVVTNEMTAIGVKCNPSLDPYLRSLIDRFSNIICSLYTIRRLSIEITRRPPSRFSRAVVDAVLNRIDQIIQPIVMCDNDNGEYSLASLFGKISVHRPVLSCFAEIIKNIYENDLCGGEVIDYLEQCYDLGIEERAEIAALLKTTWPIFFEFSKDWICFGELNDPTLEFFIWPQSKLHSGEIAALKSVLSDSTSNDSLASSAEYIFVPPLCPKSIRSFMKDIYLCKAGPKETYPVGDQIMNIKWKEMTKDSFCVMIKQHSQEVSWSFLKGLKIEHGLDEAIKVILQTLVQTPFMVELVKSFNSNGLLEMSASEVSNARLLSLTQLTLHRSSGCTSDFVRNLRFTMDSQNVIERLRNLSGSKSKLRQKHPFPSAVPSFMERVSIVVAVPEKLEFALPHGVVSKLALIFRVKLLLFLCDRKLQESMLFYSRIGVREEKYRQPLLILNTIANQLMHLRLSINEAIEVSLKSLMSSYSKASNTEDIINYQYSCLFGILKKSELNDDNIDVLESLSNICSLLRSDANTPWHQIEELIYFSVVA